MNKYVYLLKNIGLLTLSSFATKLLGFFLVPLYTSILSTTDYGTYDLINTTIGILIPILTLNIQDAVLRFALDSKCERKAIVSVANKYILSACCMVMLGLVINSFFGFFESIRNYSIYFFLMFFAQVLSGIVLSYVRGIDRIAELSISSVLSSVVTIGCNILFLVVFKWGLQGYFLANVIGPITQCIYLVFKTKIFCDINMRCAYVEEKHEMLNYCKPLIANSVAWWVNNVSDRYIVIFFCGLAENGIYSVASKIPSILNIFQTIFNQAWVLSAVKDYDPEDKSGFFSNTYKIYNCAMVLICSFIIVVNKILASFLYSKDFFGAWKYVPWLTIAIVFGALSGHLGGVFSAVKQSSIFAKSTVIGAIVNIILNLFMVPMIGPLGAAIATTICYIVVWCIRYWHVKKYIKLEINLLRDLISYIILIIQGLVLLVIEHNLNLYSIELVLFLLLLFIYTRDMREILSKFRIKI